MNPSRIDKPCIFVVSGGRTATRYLSEIFALAIKDCRSVQEPDVLRMDDPLGVWIEKILSFGILNMTLGKFTPLGNPRRLSLARQKRAVSEARAAARLYSLRHRYIAGLHEKIYAESNLQLVGLMDILPLVFPNSRIAFIVRDGRHWVRSWVNNQFPLYSRKDPFYYLKASRPSADMLPDDPFSARWNEFSQFQKICWLWRFHIEYALKSIQDHPNAKVFKYEELMRSDRHAEVINDLLKYLTAFPDGFQAEFRYNGELAGVRFHESKNNDCPGWEKWAPDTIAEFQEICGELMTRLGYGTEPDWLEKTAKSSRADHPIR